MTFRLSNECGRGRMDYHCGPVCRPQFGKHCYSLTTKVFFREMEKNSGIGMQGAYAVRERETVRDIKAEIDQYVYSQTRHKQRGKDLISLAL